MRSAGSVQGVLSAHTGDGGVHVSSPNVGALKDVRTTATEASATSVVAQEFVCMDAIAISVKAAVDHMSARIFVAAANVETVGGHRYAFIIAFAKVAENVEVLKSACTTVQRAIVGSAEAHNFAITIEISTCVSSASVHKYACTAAK